MPPIHLGNDTVVCNAQGLILDVTFPQANYVWQDSSSNPSVHVTESGEYWVNVITDCGVVTDTINVIIADVYPALVDAGSNVLECTMPFYSYQWFYNGVLLPGATEQSHTITENGTYYVAVSDSNECEGISNAILIDVVTRVNESEIISVNLYPNPNSGQFQFQSNLKPPFKITVYNTIGAEVYAKVSPTPSGTIKLTGLENGLYFINIRQEGANLTKQFVILK